MPRSWYNYLYKNSFVFLYVIFGLLNAHLLLAGGGVRVLIFTFFLIDDIQMHPVHQ